MARKLPSPPRGQSPTVAATSTSIRERANVGAWVTAIYAALVIALHVLRGTSWFTLVAILGAAWLFVMIATLRGYLAAGADWLKTQGAFAAGWVRTDELVRVRVRYTISGARLDLRDTGGRSIEVPYDDVLRDPAMRGAFFQALAKSKERQAVEMDERTEQALDIPR